MITMKDDVINDESRYYSALVKYHLIFKCVCFVSILNGRDLLLNENTCDRSRKKHIPWPQQRVQESVIKISWHCVFNITSRSRIIFYIFSYTLIVINVYVCLTLIQCTFSTITTYHLITYNKFTLKFVFNPFCNNN